VPTNRHNPTSGLAIHQPVRLRSDTVDAQRAYSAEPPPWYSDESRPPGQRDPRYGERYPDDGRFGDGSRYGEGYTGAYTGEEQRFDTGEHAPDPRFEPAEADAERTGRPGRRRARGARSGIPLPDDGADETQGEPGQFRTEMLDRGQLRRPTGEVGPAAAPGSPVATGSPVAPMVPPHAGPTATVYQAGTSHTQPLSAPREAYRAKRSGVAALLGIVAVIVEILLLLKVVLDSATAHPVNTGGVLAGLFAMCGVPLVAVGLYGLATGAAIAGGPNIGRAWLRTPLAYLPVGLILIIAAGLAG
jgi:hypothetical protein